METGLTKNRILSELSKSPHGDLYEYVPIGKQATAQEAEFMAHLIAWDQVKGQVRDAKVALPLVSLMVPGYPDEFVENSLAHLSILGPREMLKALHFVLNTRDGLRLVVTKTKVGKHTVVKKSLVPIQPSRLFHNRQFLRVLGASLLEKEKNFPKWERMAIQHRSTLRQLYTLLHIKPTLEKVNVCLFGRTFDKQPVPFPEGSLFEAVARLKDMDPVEAAGTIAKRGIPFLVAFGALGDKVKNPDVILALINRMTPTELVTNTKLLEKHGVKTNPALRGAFEKGLEKVSTSKANVLKTTTAAEAMEDEGLKEKLRGAQERQIQNLGGVEGNWLVLGDKSPSMGTAVKVAKEISGTLAKMVKGKVWLVFFDGSPTTVDVTGLSLDQIKKATEHITAGGSGTSIGCGLQRMLGEKAEIDGIVVVSDGEENTSPRFAGAYRKYSDFSGKEVPVYFYHVHGSGQPFVTEMNSADIDMQTFDLRGASSDYYSLPNLVKTMRTNRYSLIDEVMATKLLKLSDVLKTYGKEVKAHVA